MPPPTKPTGPVFVPPTPVEVRLGKLEAKIASQERALQDAQAALTALAKAGEVSQQTLQPLVQLQALGRTNPAAAEAMTRWAHQLTQGTKPLFFVLVDLLGLPLSPNDEREKQSLFLQGVLS